RDDGRVRELPERRRAEGGERGGEGAPVSRRWSTQGHLDLSGSAFDAGREDRVLALEQPVQLALGHPRPGGDVERLRARVAPWGEQRDRGVEDAPAALVARARRSTRVGWVRRLHAALPRPRFHRYSQVP